MSRYTVELRDIVENTSREEVEAFFTDYNLEDYLSEQEIAVINERGTWSKERLAKKIVDHYYMREIGLETVGLFKLKAKVAMQEIMEEKLPLIYSAAIKYDPLVNVDYVEEIDAAGSNNQSGKSKTNSSGLGVDSDTPQGQISKSAILGGSYASSTSASESESTNEDISSSNSSQTSTKHVKGNSGISATAQKMVQQYRDNIIMIDRDIIKDLASLFMGIY